jgi:hypothetical protein
MGCFVSYIPLLFPNGTELSGTEELEPKFKQISDKFSVQRDKNNITSTYLPTAGFWAKNPYFPFCTQLLNSVLPIWSMSSKRSASKN